MNEVKITSADLNIRSSLSYQSDRVKGVIGFHDLETKRSKDQQSAQLSLFLPPLFLVITTLIEELNTRKMDAR